MAQSHFLDDTEIKIQLYLAAERLLGEGYSHPQIVELLVQYVPDEKLVSLIVDKAMADEWGKLFSEARDLLAKGESFPDVIAQVQQKENDPEIAKWIVESWYDLKISYAENVTEGNTNMTEGIQWIVISGIGLILIFALDGPLRFKIILSIIFASALVGWIVGRKQRKKAAAIERFFQIRLNNNDDA